MCVILPDEISAGAISLTVLYSMEGFQRNYFLVYMFDHDLPSLDLQLYVRLVSLWCVLRSLIWLWEHVSMTVCLYVYVCAEA